ncbi:MAG TPA: helix-turn-helix transcriptional regulator [Syntrophomonadaceae bacterium]|nr:helix-turn-helix transcriptional regulator [Syntrophomonadaceae bacterium]
MDNTKRRRKELGDFLKTRRARILPSQVGIPEGVRRRTPGLRREEVASMAGIGVTWYTWLEQGRPIQVSPQVLESLSRALLLDKQETIHLYTLAQQAPPPEFPVYDNTINPMLQHVLDCLTLSPSTIVDTRCNILAWNAASAVFLDYTQMNIRQRNLLRIMFTNKGYQQIFSDWQFHAQAMLARFRADCGKYIEDPWITEFVNELRSESKEFDLWWPMHNVEQDEEIYKTVYHPALGELTFEHTTFLIADNTNLKMYVNTPVPGTDTAEKIQQLLAGKMSM